jgi:hypothetical protein
MIRFLKASAILAFLLILSCKNEKVVLETKYLRLGINGDGFLTSLKDKKTGNEYLPENIKTPLLSLYNDSVYLQPVSLAYNPSDGKATLEYKNGSKAILSIVDKSDYLRLELVSLEPRNNTVAIVWGPYAVSTDEKIGETICVVRDSSFAVGMQALNINTIEGLPDGDDNGGGGAFIDPLPGQTVPDSLKQYIGQPVPVNVNVTGDMPEYVRLYRGSAAVKKPYGSELRLFSRDRRIPRKIRNWLGNKDWVQYAEPIDVDFAGSAIALFGCPEPMTLDLIEKIELGENLPHPLLDGVWIKKSEFPGEAYLLNEGDPKTSLRYAKECGFRLIHIGDVFKTWGHFDYSQARFPGGLKDIKTAVEAAKKDGISLGVHTLTMFTQKNDGYVTPFPSDSLCKTGSSVLARDAGISDQEIFVKEPDYFRYSGSTHTVKIGKELINYSKVSADEPWRLLDCQRGQYSTKAASHPADSQVDKLTNDSYSGFYPDIHLQDTYAVRLAQVCNETGVDLMDFDGYGGESPTGHGTYGAARFIDLWYRNLDRYRLTCGAGTFHYYWHIYSFMNWGEPWYNALRESQVNYRIENQRYFERNLMPGMLGWFTLNPEFRPEEVEWIQARSAAFNAGFLLRVDEKIEKNGYRDQLFEAVREWQKARRAKAFSNEQKERMKNPKNEFHLVSTGDNSWDLFPVKLSRGFVHKNRDVQTGEPVVTKFTVENPFQEQPVQFYITAVSGGSNSSASAIELKINEYQAIKLNVVIKNGQRIVCDGKQVWLCDFTWNKLKNIEAEKIPLLGNGKSQVDMSCEFSGTDAPKLELEIKSVGAAEKVALK